MQTLKRVLGIIDNFSEWVAKILSPLVIVMTLIMMCEITLRYVFNKPTLWAHETTTMLFGAYFMLGGAYCLLRRQHVNMDIILNRLPPRAKAILGVVGYALLFLFCVVLLWKGGEMALKSLKLLECTTSVWGPPWYPVKLAIPIGTIMILLQGLANFTRDLALAITGREVK